MPNTPVQAAGEAMPKVIWNVALDFNRHNLKRLSIKDLATFADAITLAREAINGVANQPRCGEKLDVHLDEVQDGLNNVLDMVMQIAKDFQPTTRDEANERAFLIMRGETFYTDDFSVLEEILRDLRADMAPFFNREAR